MAEENKKKKIEDDFGGRKPLYTENLMEIFDFSQTAINSNRDGFIIAAQREHLQTDLKNDADAMWLMVMIMLAASVVVGLIMTSQGQPMMYLVIGAGILLLPMMYFAYTRQTNTRLDLEKTRVRSVQGEARVIWSGGASRMRARLRVHDKTFDISIFQGRALEEYDFSQMRVYYAEHSEILLSVEVPMPSIDKLKVEELDEKEKREDEDLIEISRQYDEDQT